jgi:hypothetical protein
MRTTPRCFHANVRGSLYAPIKHDPRQRGSGSHNRQEETAMVEERIEREVQLRDRAA